MPKQGILSCFPDCSCIQLQPVYFDLSSQKLLMPRQKYAVCSNRQQTVLMTEYSICAARAYSRSLQLVYALTEHESSKRRKSRNVTCTCSLYCKVCSDMTKLRKTGLCRESKVSQFTSIYVNAPAPLLFHSPCSDFITHRLFRVFLTFQSYKVKKDDLKIAQCYQKVRVKACRTYGTIYSRLTH